MNLIDLVLLAGVAAAVFFALRRIHRNRKNGCQCGCGSCGSSCPQRETTGGGRKRKE